MSFSQGLKNDSEPAISVRATEVLQYIKKILACIVSEKTVTQIYLGRQNIEKERENKNNELNCQSHHNLHPNLQVWEFFPGTKERLRTSHGKRAISVRATEVLQYIKKILVCIVSEKTVTQIYLGRQNIEKERENKNNELNCQSHHTTIHCP